MFQEHKKSNKSKKVTFEDEKVTADISVTIQRAHILQARLWLDDKSVVKMDEGRRKTMEKNLAYYQGIIDSYIKDFECNSLRLKR